MTFSLILSRWEPEDYWIKYKWLVINFKQTLLSTALWCDYLTLSVLRYFETFGCWRHYIKHFPYHGDPKCYQNWLRSGFLQNTYVTLSIKLGDFCETHCNIPYHSKEKSFQERQMFGIIYSLPNVHLFFVNLLRKALKATIWAWRKSPFLKNIIP